ncbi:hypothetical protein Droror1_Dr00005909 [Drosera rotundifolia]
MRVTDVAFIGLGDRQLLILVGLGLAPLLGDFVHLLSARISLALVGDVSSARVSSRNHGHHMISFGGGLPGTHLTLFFFTFSFAFHLHHTSPLNPPPRLCPQSTAAHHRSLLPLWPPPSSPMLSFLFASRRAFFSLLSQPQPSRLAFPRRHASLRAPCHAVEQGGGDASFSGSGGLAEEMQEGDGVCSGAVVLFWWLIVRRDEDEVFQGGIRCVLLVEIHYWAEPNVPEGDVEQLLVSLILDNRIQGNIDQVNRLLERSDKLYSCLWSFTYFVSPKLRLSLPAESECFSDVQFKGYEEVHSRGEMEHIA